MFVPIDKIRYKSLHWKLLNFWTRHQEYFWGDFSDPRFVVASMLGRIMPQNMLNIGCGVGAVETMIPTNVNLIGIDICTDCLQAAALENPLFAFIKADALRLPFKDKSFDNVLMLSVIEFVKDKPAAIAEIYRVLKIKGSAIIITPNGESERFKGRPKMTFAQFRELFDDKLFSYKPLVIKHRVQGEAMVEVEIEDDSWHMAQVKKI